MALPPITFTLCFLTRGEKVLMLHRSKEPNLGLWNGVGGHIESGESPLLSCLREVEEETGFKLESIRFAGVLTWEGFSSFPTGGLYIYSAPAPDGEPRSNEEGDLAWKTVDWIQNTTEVVSNIPRFLPHILAGDPPQWFRFFYTGEKIIRYSFEPLPSDLDLLNQP